MLFVIVMTFADSADYKYILHTDYEKLKTNITVLKDDNRISLLNLEAISNMAL
jgi:hypothetical protein